MDLIYLIGAAVLVILVYFYNKISQNRQMRRVVKKLQASWGKPKIDNDFSFDKISRYFDDYRFDQHVFQRIPDSTFHDLDFENVFKIIDRTVSKVGQQFLYYKVRTIQSIEAVKQFKKLTDVFVKDQNLRQQVQMILLGLNRFDAYNIEALINKPHYSKPAFVKFLPFLSVTAIITILLAWYFKWPVILLLLIPVFAINLVFHLKNKFHIQYYGQAMEQLLNLIKTGNQLAVLGPVNEHFKDMRFLKTVNPLKRSLAFFSYNNLIGHEFLIIFWLVGEIIKILFNIEALIFYNLIDSILSKNKAIDRLFRFVGEIDAAISTANLKSDEIPYCEPEFNTENRLEFKELINPNITNCVPNDLSLQQKSLLLTGSNMSGKTTFIKSVAISSILSETLHIAFAESFTTPFLKVYSSIKITDDILNDTSYYLEEVLRIKTFITASEQEIPCLFVLDEIFKGTNTIERVAGGHAILSYLNQPQHFVLVSTHDIELTDLLQHQDYELYHFTEQIIDRKIVFDHRLKKGKLKTRNAIKILELYDYPKRVIDEARETVKNMMNEGDVKQSKL